MGHYTIGVVVHTCLFESNATPLASKPIDIVPIVVSRDFEQHILWPHSVVCLLRHCKILNRSQNPRCPKSEEIRMGYYTIGVVVYTCLLESNATPLASKPIDIVPIGVSSDFGQHIL